MSEAAQMTTEDGDYYVSELVRFNREIDPKVKTELDTLNQSAMCINRLETELDEAKAQYNRTFAELSRQLEVLKKDIGSSIKRARPFYELKEIAKKKHAEAIKSARKFQASNSIYLAEKESVSLAELHLGEDNSDYVSSARQITFNEALLRLRSAEKEKSVCEQEHLKCAVAFSDVENKMHVLEKNYKKSIVKARSYFEIKKELEVKLLQVKQSVEDIQQAIRGAKQQYTEALTCLEKISDSIHEKRRQNVILVFPRAVEDPKSEKQLPTSSVL